MSVRVVDFEAVVDRTDIRPPLNDNVDGDLLVWWIPQVPSKPFGVRVENLKEARLVLDVLAGYDLFLLQNKIRRDYSNVGGLMVFNTTESDWTDWYDDEGRDIDNPVYACP